MIEINIIDNLLVRTVIKLKEKTKNEPNKYYGGVAHNHLSKKQVWSILIYCKTSPHNPLFTNDEFIAKGLHEAIKIANIMTSDFNNSIN